MNKQGSHEIFDEIIQKFRKLFQVSSKKAERFLIDAVYDPQKLESLYSILDNINQGMGVCGVCSAITLDNNCLICSQAERDDNFFCVTENCSDLLKIEETNAYQGKYHVLTGLVSLKKPTPLVLENIQKLIKRLTPSTEEVILALPATFEGEITTEFISRDIRKVLGDKIKITSLARGIPVGGSLDYIDLFTLKTSFKNRI